MRAVAQVAPGHGGRVSRADLLDQERCPRRVEGVNLPSREEAADGLRDQAASCRRLALRARTQSGCDALTAVAEQFETDADHLRPSAVSVINLPAGDAAALVRVRLALERQSAERLKGRAASRSSEI